MQNFTIIVANDAANCVTWKKLITNEDFNLVIIKSPPNPNNLIETAIKSLMETKSAHLLVVTEPSVITPEFIRYIKYASTRLRGVDFFQIGGGSNLNFLTLTYQRNFPTALLVTLLTYLPQSIIKSMYKLFWFLPINVSKKQLIEKACLRHYKNVGKLGPGNIYLSNKLNWYNIRVPLTSFFLNNNWLIGLSHLQKTSVLSFERANVALARTAKYNAASKFTLF